MTDLVERLGNHVWHWMGCDYQQTGLCTCGRDALLDEARELVRERDDLAAKYSDVDILCTSIASERDTAIRERDQWQESCGRNYVRAEEADDRAETLERERDEAKHNFARIAPQHKLMRQALQSLGEQLLVPGNWSPLDAIALRGMVKAARETEQERDEARAALRYYAITSTYQGPRTGGVLKGCSRDTSRAPILRDRGKVARAALGEEEG